VKENSGDSRLEQRVQELERKLGELSHALDEVRARLSTGEVHPQSISAIPHAPADPALPFELPTSGAFVRLLPQIGRSFLILGGAFLIRSLTDSATVGRLLGVALGLTYSCLWILAADRLAKRGRRSSAVTLGMTAAIIAYPLIGETTTRWPIFSPGGAAAAVTAITALFFVVAWRRSLSALAWAAAGAAAVTSFALAFLTEVFEPFAACLLAIGIACAWFAYGRHHWHVLRWPAAIAADVLVLAAAARLILSPSAAGGVRASATFFLWIAFALPFLYMGSFALRTLIRRRDVTAFEIAQTIAALVIGLGGAAAVERRDPQALAMLGGSALAIGAVCYALAFVFVERQQGQGRNFLFYATLALGLTLAGAALFGGGASLGLFWGALAFATAFLAARFGRLTLAVHSSFYCVAAAWQTGLLRTSWEAFGAPAGSLSSPVTGPGLVTIAIAAAGYVFLARENGKGLAATMRFPRSVLIILVVAGCGALVVSALRPLAGGQPPGSDPGGVAAMRMAVLAAASLVLASGRRWTALPEFTGLVYAVLLLATAKLLLEDLPHGRAATLFVGFLFYGLALLAAPRLLRSRSAVTEPSD
jgi:hypothetical protein